MQVVSVSARKGHGLGKTPLLQIKLLTGLGVVGDAHCGAKVKHRSRRAKDPTLPNIRQVHLIQTELLDELAAKGFCVLAGELGENILTKGVDLLALPAQTELRFVSGAVVLLTGLRNPCSQLEGHSAGLMKALLHRAENGALIRKGGVMGIVLQGGDVTRGDGFIVTRPVGEHEPLMPV